jgi:hypothetical protein
MASSKRQRQRANRQLNNRQTRKPVNQTPSREAWEKRVYRLFEAGKKAYEQPNLVQRVAGLTVAAAFYYNLVAKQGAVLNVLAEDSPVKADTKFPTFRGLLPEPFDFMNHIGNVYWTQLLAKTKIPFTQTSMNDSRFGVAHIDHRLFGNERPSLTKCAIRAGAIGVGLHTVVEGVSEAMPGVMGKLTGGFDPIDVVYGGVAAAVIAGYSFVRQQNAVDAADAGYTPPQPTANGT